MIEKINWLGSLGSYGTDKGQFKHPYGVAFDANNHLYVTDYGLMVAIGYKNLKAMINLWFSRDTCGSGNSKLNLPFGIIVHNDEVYITECHGV